VLNTVVGQGAERRVASLHDALAQLDPIAWRSDHDGWLELMTACRFAGIARKDFIAWSISDPHYAGHAEVIGVKWDSTQPKHGGALFAALKTAGIKVRPSRHGPSARVELSANPSSNPTRNLKPRVDCIQRRVERERGNNREPMLFWAACKMAEIVAEGKLKLWVAQGLLESACRSNGLWREDAEGCRKTMASAFRTVERRILGDDAAAQVAAVSQGEQNETTTGTK
jgi:hypothetical protein